MAEVIDFMPIGTRGGAVQRTRIRGRSSASPKAIRGTDAFSGWKCRPAFDYARQEHESDDRSGTAAVRCSRLRSSSSCSRARAGLEARGDGGGGREFTLRYQ